MLLRGMGQPAKCVRVAGRPVVCTVTRRPSLKKSCFAGFAPELNAATVLSEALSLSTRRLAAACTAHWEIGDVNSFSASANVIPGIVTLDGVQIGHPVEVSSDGARSCDQIASIGVADGIVRGVSSLIDTGFSVPIIGNTGELIEFKYWNAAEGKEYISEYRYTMEDYGQMQLWQRLPERRDMPAVLPPCVGGCV